MGFPFGSHVINEAMFVLLSWNPHAYSQLALLQLWDQPILLMFILVTCDLSWYVCVYVQSYV